MSAPQPASEALSAANLVAAGCPPFVSKSLADKIARCIPTIWAKLTPGHREALICAVAWGVVEHSVLLIPDEPLASALTKAEVLRCDWSQTRQCVVECCANSAGFTDDVLRRSQQIVAAAEEDGREIVELRTRLHHLLNYVEKEGLGSLESEPFQSVLLGAPEVNEDALRRMSAEITRSWNNAIHLLRRSGIWTSWWTDKLKGDISFAEGVAFFKEVEAIVATLPHTDFPEIPSIIAVLQPSLHHMDPGVREILSKEVTWRPAL